MNDAIPTPEKPRIHWDQLPLSTYTEFGIDKELYAQSGGARCRQHVNPLKRDLQVPVNPLDWDLVFDDPTLPLCVDVGSGYGRFLLALAGKISGQNCLGLEIRDPAIDRANRWANQLGYHRRVRFVRANATVSLTSMLSTYPGPIELITIQFPDPHFKNKHKKRRVVQRQLVTAIRDLLQPGAQVFLQSDVEEVAKDMRNQFELEAGGHFALAGQHSISDAVFHSSSTSSDAPELRRLSTGWLRSNPLPVPTERELHVLAQGLPVYRVLLEKR